jgi:Ca2+:H+ antiporter
MLQWTITGVVVLHLLLVPGFAFLTGGLHIWEQNMQPHATQLNHSLLSIGYVLEIPPYTFWAQIEHTGLLLS